MRRYTKISDKIKEGRIIRYSSAHYPVIPITDNDIYIYTRKKDRLDNLAYQFYNDQRFWIILAIANDLGKGSVNVPTGIQLRIPYPMDEVRFNDLINEQGINI